MERKRLLLLIFFLSIFSCNAFAGDIDDGRKFKSLAFDISLANNPSVTKTEGSIKLISGIVPGFGLSYHFGRYFKVRDRFDIGIGIENNPIKFKFALPDALHDSIHLSENSLNKTTLGIMDIRVSITYTKFLFRNNNKIIGLVGTLKGKFFVTYGVGYGLTDFEDADTYDIYNYSVSSDFGLAAITNFGGFIQFNSKYEIGIGYSFLPYHLSHYPVYGTYELLGNSQYKSSGTFELNEQALTVSFRYIFHKKDKRIFDNE